MTIQHYIIHMFNISDLKKYKCALCDYVLCFNVDNYNKHYFVCKNNCLCVYIGNIIINSNTFKTEKTISDITYRIYNNNNDSKYIHYTIYAGKHDGFKIYLHDLLGGNWYKDVPNKYFNILSLSKKDIFDIINKYEATKILM